MSCEMAMELMMSYGGRVNGGDGFPPIAAVKMEDTALREAASAGIHGVEEFLKLIGKSQTKENQTEITAVTDVAVNSFKKVISLLGRSTTGHARFRRGPLKQTEEKKAGPSVFSRHKTGQYGGSAFRVYCPTPIHGRPPLSHSKNQTKNGWSSSAPQEVSARGDTDSNQMSSGFEFPNQSHISGSRAKPPLSSVSLKRRCNSSSSSRCHCSKKRLDPKLLSKFRFTDKPFKKKKKNW